MAKRNQIDPSKVRKAHRETNNYGFVQGERVNTPTGFIVEGSVTKYYETYYDLMMPGTSGALLSHPNKTRTYRIIDGHGFFVTMEENSEIKSRRIAMGDEITVSPNIKFSIRTTTDAPLHLFVCQDAKYGVKLQEIQPADEYQNFDRNSIGQAPSLDFAPHERYVSKAAEQLAQMRGQPFVREDNPEVNYLSTGINARPMTVFED